MSKKAFIALLAFACFALAPADIWAQTRTVTGTVTSADDEQPLPGASVVLAGTSQGTATNSDGHYSIDIPDEDDAVLEFSFIGFEPVEVVVGDRTEIDVVLGADSQALGELVVVGYGQQIQQQVTGNISRVSSEDIENTPVTSVEAALQGRAAGVDIQSGSGKLGQGMQVRVRGASSITADNQPLFVIDGIPVTTENLSGTSAPTNPLADINFNDIESIEILKDASAAAIYGSRASNGVVLITTKSGVGGETQFSVNFQHSRSNPTNTVDFLNTREYVELYSEAARNSESIDGVSAGLYQRDVFDMLMHYAGVASGEAGQVWADGNGTLTWDLVSPYLRHHDWQQEAFQEAYGNQVDISAQGGSEDTQFYLSGSYHGQQGIVLRDDFERITGRINLDHSVNDRFDVGGRLSIGRTINNRISNDNSFANPMQLVAQLPFNPINDQDDPDSYNHQTLYFNGLLYDGNARFETTVFRGIGNAYAEYQILPSLTVRSEFGLDVLDQQEDEYYNSQVARNTGAQNGLGYNTFNRVINYTTNNFATYRGTFADLHSLDVTGGFSFQQSQRNANWVQGEEFPNDDFQQINSAADITGGGGSQTGYSFLSYFARVNYALDDRYLLSLSARTDGSSRFGIDNRYGFFPAGSVGWILSEEDFFSGNDVVSFLKLRASYGLTGNAEISNFPWQGLWGATGYSGISGIVPSQTPNPELQWERTAQYNVGVEFGFFDDRIYGEIDYYQKKTSDLLLNVNVPATSGFTSQTRNVGSLSNHGVEFSLNTINVTGDFQWRTNFNIAANRNEITDLDGQVITGGFINRAIEGEPIGVFYGYEYAGVDPENGDALYYVNETGQDGNIVDPEATTNSVNEANRVVIGDPNPDFTGGLGNEFSYAGFDLNLFFQFSYGNDVFDGGGKYRSANAEWWDNQTRDQLDRWQEPGDQTNVPQARLYIANGLADSDRYVYDGSYLRLKNVTLGYTLPSRYTEQLSMDSARLYMTGVNLLTFTDYPLWDPEVNADFASGNIGLGTDFYSAPQARTFSLGLQVTF